MSEILTPMVYGYLRVSTDKQDLQSNKQEIICFCTELGHNAARIIWIEESISGTKHWKNRKLNNIVESIKKGDIFITSEISRIARTMTFVNEFICTMLQKGAVMYFTKSSFKVDDSITSQTLLFAYNLTSQIERDFISERTKSALKAKQNNGIKLGRPKGTGKKKLDNVKREILEDLDKGIKKKVIAKKYNVSHSTLTNYLKKNT